MVIPVGAVWNRDSHLQARLQVVMLVGHERAGELSSPLRLSAKVEHLGEGMGSRRNLTLRPLLD